jgi:starch synthase
MKITHISAECYPIAKAGGLADVVGALPKYQALLGHQTQVVVPFYHNKFRSEHQFKSIYTGWARLSHHNYPFNILVATDFDPGYELYHVDIPGLFDRPNIYSYGDDTERFITFQTATVNWLVSLEHIPDVVHCHDQQSGFIPFYMHKINDYKRLEGVHTIFTIHNGQYQGQFGFDKLHYLPPFHSFFTGLVEWHKDINPMASAIKNAHRVTTVSPSYMDEIRYNMSGLENLLEYERGKCSGILNGIDTDVWDPATDSLLVKNYTTRSVVGGKNANKTWLYKEFNLEASKPLFVYIGRLVTEKGADVLPDAIFHAFQKLGRQMNILVLGSGDRYLEEGLLFLEQQLKGNYCSYIGFNEKLSHIMYAGADFLLMPSRVEPCGLNQMYALRYGTVPVVRRTGGLKDTVVDIGDNGFGICHDQCTSGDIIHSIERALELHKDTERFSTIRKDIMKIDHSWLKSAEDYVKLYTK